MVQMKKLAWASMMIVALCAISIDAQTTAPTTSPTKSPTTSPTKSPTASPTKKPTNSPTKFPTKSPATSNPTKSPTEAPTGTEAPTKAPTSSPTKSPTTPTEAPVTKSPTSSPTGSLVRRNTCATYKNRLDDGTIGMCAEIVDYEYLLPDGLNQEALEAIAYNRTFSSPTAPVLLAIVPDSCALQLKKTVCAAVFQKCEYVDVFYVNTDQVKCAQLSVTAGVNATFDVLKLANGLCGPFNVGQGPFDVKISKAPGFVPGKAVTWLQEADGNAAVLDSNVCAPNGLVKIGNDCKRAVPIGHKKDVCTKLHKIATAAEPNVACPSVSGVFGASLFGTAVNTSIDPVVAGFAKAELQSVSVPVFGNCFNAIGARATQFSQVVLGLRELPGGNRNALDGEANDAARKCAFEELYNSNLLGLLGLLPDCDALLTGQTFGAFSDNFAGEIPGTSLVTNRTTANLDLVSKGSCQFFVAVKAATGQGSNPVLASIPACLVNLGLTTLAAHNSVDSKALSLSTGIAFADLLKSTSEAADGTTQVINPICEKILKADANQPSVGELGIIGKGNITLAKGAFFVSGALGLPPLPTNLTDKAGSNPDSFFNKFTNQGETHTLTNGTVIATPLCTAGGKNGTNSLECLLNAVNFGVNLLPKWVNPKCRSALQELVCTTGLLKVEIKKMCFVPSNAGVHFGDFQADCDFTPLQQSPISVLTKRMPFVFALPRFANRDVCAKAQTECQPFVTFLEESSPATAATLKKALDCDQKINVTCDDNKIWRSTVWPAQACGSAFNGLTRYPSSGAVLANITTLGGATFAAYKKAGDIFGLFQFAGIQDDLGVTGTVAAVQNFSEAELLSQISCPAPLSPVQALPAAGADLEFLGCADVCTTSMFSSEDNQKVYKLEFNMAAASIVGCALVLIGSIVMHRPGYIMILFTFMILGLSIVFLITNSGANYEELWCEDAQTPKNQADGGYCQLQAVGFVFFSLAACGFWFAASVEVFVKAFYKRDVPVWWPLFHAFGGACLFVIIMGATNSQGYKGPNMFCVATEEGAGIENAEYLLFFAPVAIQAIVGTIILMIGLVKAVCTGFFFPNQKVQVVFCLTFALLFLIFGLGSLLNALLAEPVTEGAKAWIGCLLNNFNDEITDPATDPKANLTSLNEELVALEVEPRADGSGCGANFPVTFNLSQVEVALAAMLLQGVALVVVLWPAILFPKIAVEGDSGADEGKLTVRA